MADKGYFVNGVMSTAAASTEGTAELPGLEAALAAAQGRCIRIFVAGAVTHVGKTTICLAILSALRKAGLQAKELAYIKPATQCEAPDLLLKYCEAEGIENVSGENAPLVFYQGFTRSFLEGEQGTSSEWLQRIAERVDALAAGRRVLIVDGVGFPAVGSIVGVDNADVAKAARAPVVLVAKCGVGAAVDSFNLNCTYFLSKGVPVLGAIFNFGALSGFHSWEQCAPSLRLWFSGRRERCYGIVPLCAPLDGLREQIAKETEDKLTEFAALNASHVATHVDLGSLVADAGSDPWCRSTKSFVPKANVVAAEKTEAATSKPSLSRQEVEAAAKKKGATGGG
eukprot:gnl/TRDRNA2_/TRDRNA2_78231_c1_seq1.p1 gnl/TRDRNA2_/TRDRNA2_78231_c1~~gnl/TRDRNA2_/TRDRNA2_78231_c1_seq1.p1  ORF type:complete len:340 (+),score=61.00 gnl/TRDRNA2_/TRDRNA2_78231_c1_seq1:55-1074(+)